MAQVVGTAGNDTLTGTGSDVLVGMAGSDTLIGAVGGGDTASYRTSPGGINVLVSAATVPGYGTQQYNVATVADGFGGTDTTQFIVSFVGSDFADTFRNTTSRNVQATVPPVVFEGYGGNDTFFSTSAKFLGALDTLSYAHSPSAVTVDYVAGRASDGWGGTDIINGGFFLVGSAFDDTFIITNQTTVDGGAGHDTVILDRAMRVASRTTDADGTVHLTAPNVGTNVLRNIEVVQLVDGRLEFGADDPAVAVVRLYQAGLGRAPDEGGQHYWANALGHGATLGQLAGSFLGAPEFAMRFGSGLADGAFVDQLYTNVLHRAGEASGRAYWTDQLAHGVARADVLVGFSESAENRAGTAALAANGVWDLNENAAEVARLYDTTFGRLPDYPGLKYWRGVLDGGGALLDVAKAYVGSAEFMQKYGALSNHDFVVAEYGNTLHRAGDAGGIDYWTGKLDVGASRAAVVLAFSESAEHVALTTPNIMNADPGKEGIVIDSGAPRAAAALAFSESAEHVALTTPDIMNADLSKEGIVFA